MSQEIKNIPVKDLVLWTENPRDPIDPSANDDEIIRRACLGSNSSWTINKLIQAMGGYYDLSELPTVALMKNKYVVLDGNQRMILAKIKLGYAQVDGMLPNDLPDFPVEIPCNVCSLDIGYNNILRKHGSSGSWTPLNRDYFLYKNFGREKSFFIKLEEATGLISSHPKVDQLFVKEELLTEKKLSELGFELDGDQIKSRYSAEDSAFILEDIKNKIADETINTRNHRGLLKEVLSDKSKNIIEGSAAELLAVDVEVPPIVPQPRKKRTPRVSVKSIELFQRMLYLEVGHVNNLYRDIQALYDFKVNNSSLSDSFNGLIRMALRLLAETAAQNAKTPESLDAYIKKNFDKAKAGLTQDQKTSLHTQSVKKDTIISLLHIGAHNYEASQNLEQTIAISVILAAMIEITHGRN